MDLIERLGALATRRDEDGIYTDANIAFEAAKAIRDLTKALESARSGLAFAVNHAGVKQVTVELADVDAALARAKGGAS